MFVHIVLLVLGVGAVARPPYLHPRIVGCDAALNASYDFVIVGGGTSGLTVADRLRTQTVRLWNVWGVDKLVCVLNLRVCARYIHASL